MSGAALARAAAERHGARCGAWLAWGAAALVAAAAVPAFGAFTHGESLCLLRRAAHVACPTCGMTRALGLLWRGDLAGSLALHPGAAALVLQLAAGWAWWGLWLGGRVPSRPDHWLPRVAALNAGALGALWLLRFSTGALPPAG